MHFHTLGLSSSVLAHAPQPAGPSPFDSKTRPRKRGSSSPTASARRNWDRCSKAPAPAASGSTTTTTVARISTWSAASRSGRDPSLSAEASARNSAPQSSLPQRRQRHVHRRHRRRPESPPISSAWPRSRPTTTTTASSICWSPATARRSSTATRATARSTDVTAKAGIKVDGWSISSAWLDYDRDGCVDLFVGRYVKFDPEVSHLLRRRQLSRAARLRGRHQSSVPQQLQWHVHGCERKSGIGAFKGRTMGVTAADFDGDG